MAVQWKTKASQRTQMGKASQAYKSLIGTKSLALIPSEALPCPTGEQIVNGGFETGDFTGWTVTGTPAVLCDGGGALGTVCYVYDEGAPFSVEQELATPVSYACIQTFRLFYLNYGCNFPSVEVIITYSDDTTTTINILASHYDWTELNIKDYLEPTKAVKKIQVSFACSGGVLWQGCLDEISLVGNG